MDHPRLGCVALGLLITVVVAGSASGQSGDVLCDATQSSADTCVILGVPTVTDGDVLTFTAANVELRGTLTVLASGVCSAEPTGPCASDADCAPAARCDRPARLTLEAVGTFGVDVHAQIIARGVAVAGDRVGPDGGSITIQARDVAVAGILDASAEGMTAVAAGRGGRIAVHATGSVTIADTGRLDASSARGGCGGSVTIDGPATLATGGLLSVDGATLGGTIDLAAGDSASAAGVLQASNTNGDPANRPACADGVGGGRITVRAGRVEFTGSAKTKGKEAGGGVVRLVGDRGVVVDSGVGTVPISVLGGDADAFTTGGGVFLVATAGDVAVRRGAIEADGLGSGLGSDAGTFSLSATGATRCETSQRPCTSAADCAPGEACVESGGNVLVAAPLSAVGGAGLGSGCVACEILGTGTVTVASPVNVGGGKHALGGKVTMSAGSDLTLGPGAVSAAGGDGGDVILVAGARAGAVRDVSGVLRLVNGTEVWAVAFDAASGFGGHVGIEGCDVHLESGTTVGVDGILSTDGIDVVAHNRLLADALATLSALPAGPITLSYGVAATVSPDATLVPPAVPVRDPTLPPCPACGNGVVEPLEDCDGAGTCASATSVCLPPGLPGECTCRDTCGTVPGIQPGEDCDGADLGGQTCSSRGFAGGALACKTDCTFDEHGCVAAVCGDGSVGASEACDPGGMDGTPPSFGGETCESLGYPGGGVLACTPDCTAIVTRPRCAGNVAESCTVDGECGAAGPCVGGCIECGNGFLDPGEECDEGPSNGSAANHCRVDCRAPRCGDETLDFPHCAGNADAVCATAADCAAGEACVAGEQCDRGAAVCLGGANDGLRCCRAGDCPDGDCSGADCSANRDDVPGCCRCDCTLPAVECGDCDDGNPCTADACDPASGCTHSAVADGTSCSDRNACNGAETCRAGACQPGVALACDDGDPCTVDTCGAPDGCQHQPLGYADAGDAVEASLFVPACTADPVPPAIVGQLRKAHALIASAAAKPKRAVRLVHRAIDQLELALRRARRAARRRLSHGCGVALTGIVEDALRRAECLVPGADSTAATNGRKSSATRRWPSAFQWAS